MDPSSSTSDANNMDLLEKSMYDISGNDLLDIWDADIASMVKLAMFAAGINPELPPPPQKDLKDHNGLGTAVNGLIRPNFPTGNRDDHDSLRNSLEDGGQFFPENESFAGANNNHGLHSSFNSDIRQESIVRDDKLLTEGEGIARPDSSDSDYCTTSTSTSRGGSASNSNNRQNFTLNQNVHDSLLNCSSSYPPPPQLTCMAPLSSSGSTNEIKGENAFIGAISKIETHEDTLQDSVDLQLPSSPSSTSWIGGVPTTTPNSPLLSVLNSNVSMLNSISTSLPMIPTMSAQRVFDGSITAQYNQDPHFFEKDALSNDQLLNTGIRNDPSVRLFQQGSDGDSLPESPMSSGHDDQEMNSASVAKSSSFLQRHHLLNDEIHNSTSSICSIPEGSFSKRRKLATKPTSSETSLASLGAASSLDILMDDSSPPSSVTSSNCIAGSGENIDSNEDKDIENNAFVSSTTRGSLFPSMTDLNIKKEPESVRGNISRQTSNDKSFDEEDSLEEYDDDDLGPQSIENEANRSCLNADIKPNRIYLAKTPKYGPNTEKSSSMPTVNKNIFLGGKGISSVASEATNFSTITCSKPGVNGIEFPMGSSARTILKLPNPISTGSNGALILHQPSRSFNANPTGKPNIVPPVSVKPNGESVHIKRANGGSCPSKSIICHSKCNSSSNPQWLSTNNTNIKIRSPMTIVNSPLSKIPLNKKRPISNNSPQHFEIRSASTELSEVISESRISNNKNVGPSMARKPTFSSDQYPYNSDSVPSSSSVAYVGSTSIHPKLPLPSLSSILRYAYQVNPLASSGSSSYSGNNAKQESVYTNPHSSHTQTTSSNQKNVSSMVPNLTSRVVFNGAINMVNGTRQNVGKSTSMAANQIVAAAASAAGLGNNSTMPNQNSSHGVRASMNGGRYIHSSTTATRQPIQTSLISSQPKGATGILHLTEEEKRTLISEGYTVPQRLPLSKSEEKSLKKIRRKIKNKISAQESRRKKKEYMDTLEKKMDKLACEVDIFRQKCMELENKNASLVAQVKSLESQLAIGSTSSSPSDD